MSSGFLVSIKKINSQLIVVKTSQTWLKRQDKDFHKLQEKRTEEKRLG